MQKIIQTYAQQGIKLTITPKRVKNINFRIKPIDESPFTSLMVVSYPMRMPQTLLFQSLQNRLGWAIDCQQKQCHQKNLPKKSTYFNDIKDLENLTLQSEVYFLGEKWRLVDLMEDFFLKKRSANPLLMREFKMLGLSGVLCFIYRYCLNEFIQNQQAYWQDKVGKSAKSITTYRMKSRWGSCSTQARTIRLSIWLAQFPPSCADYVLVHELCHLYHADHSAKFWACVEKVMPDYDVWHKMLKSGLADEV